MAERAGFGSILKRNFIKHLERTDSVSVGPAAEISCASRTLAGIAKSERQSQLMKGSTTRTPAFANSIRFRVATVRPWTIAVVAMRLSLIAWFFRFFESYPCSC